MESYMLILERLPGDFIPIDLTLVNEIFDNDIKSIDHFTSFLSKDKLIKLIKDLNIVTSEYLDGNFYIIDSKKRKYPAIFKETFSNFSLTEFLYVNKDNKNIINTIYNIYPNNKSELKDAIGNGDLIKIISLIKTLPYIEGRKLRLYIVNNLISN